MLSDEDKLQRFLQENELTQYIRLQWIDFSGVLRTRFLPVARCLQIARGNEDYRVQDVCMIIPVSTAPQSSPTGNEIEIWALRPDWSSLRVCGFRVSHASVMCFVEHQEIEEIYSKCPRMLLSRALKEFGTVWGTKATISYEIEVTLLDQDAQPLNQLDRLNSYQTTNGLRGKTLDIVEEFVDTLKASSINIYHFHMETRHQIEFALTPESPLEAIDSLVLAQETFRTVFTKHNIRATMTPKPVLNGPPNGIHLHTSVDKLALPLTDKFLAGILSHMQSLCAFGMANYDGYGCAAAGAAGTWIGFGTENRGLPVRKISGQHWEFRMMDCTSNPYLFTAAVILAGMSGLSEKSDGNLAWKDCRVIPESLDMEERAKYQLKNKIPSSLKEALEALKADSTAKTWMSEDLLNSYISVKEKEVETFQKMTDDQRRLRFLEYF